MSIRNQLAIWGAAAALLALVLWGVGDVLLPFVAGAGAAYLLDPLAARLVRMGLPRAAAVSVIIFGAAAALVAALVLLIPLLAAQTGALLQTLPDLAETLHADLSERFPTLMPDESATQRALDGAGEALRTHGMQLAEEALGAVAGLVSVALFIVITPVVSFYLLLDWPRVVARIDALLPRAHAPVIRDLAGQIDCALAGFVRGQLSVCAILSVYYATALGLAGLQFGLVVGVIAGVISFIPWVGAIIGGALALGLALFQFWDSPGMIALIAGIFALGQFLEGNVLVPRLVGGWVGLHPVWLLMAVSVFGALFGFTGMLVAVPAAAAAGVLVRFAVLRYTQSALYRDTTTDDDTPPR